MKPALLKFCPQCGSVGYQYRDRKFWYCPVCLFTYFHNVATSASIIAEVNGSILMLVRSKNPGKGLLALPGGFVDAGERAEDAALRECKEETGLSAVGLSFVGSWPNEYTYKNVIYKTCDIYFSASIPQSLETLKLAENEVAGFRLVSPSEVATAPIAFESARTAILAHLDSRKLLEEA